jgi:hypothetical protein
MQKGGVLILVFGFCLKAWGGKNCITNRQGFALITLSNFVKNAHLYCRSERHGHPLREITDKDRSLFGRKFQTQVDKSYRQLIKEMGESQMLNLDSKINNVMSLKMSRDMKAQCDLAGALSDEVLSDNFKPEQLPNFAAESAVVLEFYQASLCK